MEKFFKDLNINIRFKADVGIELKEEKGWWVDIYYHGVMKFRVRENSNVEARGNSNVVARENSNVVARGNSNVVARGNSNVEAWGNSNVEAWGNSNVEARENSNVVAWENSNVEAWENSNVVAWGNSNVVAWGNSNVVAWENSNVEAWENSNVVARGNSNVEARGNSNVVAWGNSNVEAWGNSNVEAWGNSNVEAWENSNVVAWENSNVEARAFSFIRRLSTRAKIKIESDFAIEVSAIRKFKKDTIVYKKAYIESGFERQDIVVEMKCKKGQVFQSERGSKCRTSEAEVIAFYDLNHEKLDEKITQHVKSQYDSEFKYEIGKVAKANYDENIEECSEGIHFYLTYEEAANH